MTHSTLILISKRKLFRLFFRIPAIIIGLYLTYRVGIEINERNYALACKLTTGLIVLSIIEFVLADIITDQKYPPSTTWLLDKLEPKMEVYSSNIQESLNSIVKSFTNCDVSKISSVFLLKVDLFDHLFEESQEGLLQITNYEGPHKGKKWRFFYSTKGIVGKCMRTHEMQTDSFDNTSYDKKMTEHYGYSKSELGNHNRNAQSYLAYPLLKDDVPVGIIYFTSDEMNVFPLAIDKSTLEKSAGRILGYLEGAKIIS